MEKTEIIELNVVDELTGYKAYVKLPTNLRATDTWETLQRQGFSFSEGPDCYIKEFDYHKFHPDFWKLKDMGLNHGDTLHKAGLPESDMLPLQPGDFVLY